MATVATVLRAVLNIGLLLGCGTLERWSVPLLGRLRGAAENRLRPRGSVH